VVWIDELLVFLCRRFVSMWLVVLAHENRSTYLHRLGLVVTRVDGVLAVAGCAHQLPAINRNRRELEGAICVLDPSTVLPLHDAAGT
jgi:hypothetical protein